MLLERVQGISAECGQLQSSCSVMQQRSELGFSRLVNITQVKDITQNTSYIMHTMNRNLKFENNCRIRNLKSFRSKVTNDTLTGNLNY